MVLEYSNLALRLCLPRLQFYPIFLDSNRVLPGLAVIRLGCEGVILIGFPQASESAELILVDLLQGEIVAMTREDRAQCPQVLPILWEF